MAWLDVDTRESAETKRKFEALGELHKDLDVSFKALNPGDFEWEHGIVEHKELDDLVSSFINQSEEYHRLESQIERLKLVDKSIVQFLIVGENYKDIYSNVHPHAVNGQIAKLTCLGFDVVMMDSYNPWEDYIYRLVRMSAKYLD